MAELLSQEEVEAGVRELDGWAREGDAITRTVEVATFMDGIRLVSAVAGVAEEQNHHPDIDIRYTAITFTLSTHSAGGITANDLRLAGDIDRLAA